MLCIFSNAFLSVHFLVNYQQCTLYTVKHLKKEHSIPKTKHINSEM